MKKKHYLLTLILVLAFAWFLATVFVDFFAVPNVFRTVSSRDEASSLGVIIFSRFNYIECILGFLIAFLSIKLFTSKMLSKKLFLIPTFLLIVFPLIYTFSFSPNIKYYNEQKIELGEDSAVQEKLDLFHKLYVRVDSVKLLMLLYTVVYSNVLLLAKED